MRKEEAIILIESVLAKKYEFTGLIPTLREHLTSASHEDKELVMSILVKNYLHQFLGNMEPELLLFGLNAIKSIFKEASDDSPLLRSFFEHYLDPFLTILDSDIESQQDSLISLSKNFCSATARCLMLQIFTVYFMDQWIQNCPPSNLAEMLKTLAEELPEYAEILESNPKKIKAHFEAENNRPIREAAEALYEHTTLPEDMIVEISGYVGDRLFHPHRAAANFAAACEYAKLPKQARG